MSTEPVWCSIGFSWGVILLVAPASHSRSSRSTLYNVCSVHWGVFSMWGDTMSILGDVMSTSGDVQYIRELP